MQNRPREVSRLPKGAELKKSQAGFEFRPGEGSGSKGHRRSQARSGDLREAIPLGWRPSLGETGSGGCRSG